MKLFSKKTGNKQSQRGYMLIEIMVSLSIFAIVAVSSTGAMLAIIDANAKAQNLKSVMDNLSVAVENISRTMRIGTDFKCTNSSGGIIGNTDQLCSGGSDGISFLPQDSTGAGDRVQYLFQTTNGENTGVIRRVRNGVTTDLTAPEVTITHLKFHMYGGNTNDGQPRIFININGTAGLTDDTKTPFNIQTTVSERQQDNS